MNSSSHQIVSDYQEGTITNIDLETLNQSIPSSLWNLPQYNNTHSENLHVENFEKDHSLDEYLFSSNFDSGWSGGKFSVRLRFYPLSSEKT